MKTQLQYPNGLSITIEHEEIAAPQLLEVKRISDKSEAEFFNEIAIENDNLAKKNESLERTVSEFETVVSKLENENTELKNTLEAVAIESNDQRDTINSLREEIQNLKAQATEFPTRHVSPSQQEKFFKKKETTAPEKNKRTPLTWSIKTCANCGHPFQPTGPRSRVCPDCKAAAEAAAAGNDFSENPE